MHFNTLWCYTAELIHLHSGLQYIHAHYGIHLHQYAMSNSISLKKCVRAEMVPRTHCIWILLHHMLQVRQSHDLG